MKIFYCLITFFVYELIYSSAKKVATFLQDFVSSFIQAKGQRLQPYLFFRLVLAYLSARQKDGGYYKEPLSEVLELVSTNICKVQS